MHAACITGDASRVAYLLSCGGCAGCDGEGHVPLVQACYRGHVEVVRLLLAAQNVDVNAADVHLRMTALVAAAVQGHVSIVKLLCRHTGIDLERCEFGLLALRQACIAHQAGTAQALIEAGADINAKHGHPADPPVHTVFKHFSLNCLRVLLACPHLDLDALNGAGWCIRSVMATCFPQRKAGEPHVHARLHSIAEAMVLLLVDEARRPSPRIDLCSYLPSGTTMLHVLPYEEHVSEYLWTQLLTVTGHIVNAFTTRPLQIHRTPLLVAAECGNATAVKALLSVPTCHVWVRDHLGDTALHRVQMPAGRYGANTQALQDDAISLLDLLYERMVRTYGHSPDLHPATPTLVELPVDRSTAERGTTEEITCNAAFVACQRAIEQDHPRILRWWLRTCPSLVARPSAKGCSLITFACRIQAWQYALYLLEQYPDCMVTAIDQEGCSAIHRAALAYAREIPAGRAVYSALCDRPGVRWYPLPQHVSRVFFLTLFQGLHEQRQDALDLAHSLPSIPGFDPRVERIGSVGAAGSSGGHGGGDAPAASMGGQGGQEDRDSSLWTWAYSQWRSRQGLPSARLYAAGLQWLESLQRSAV